MQQPQLPLARLEAEETERGAEELAARV